VGQDDVGNNRKEQATGTNEPGGPATDQPAVHRVERALSIIDNLLEDKNLNGVDHRLHLHAARLGRPGNEKG